MAEDFTNAVNKNGKSRVIPGTVIGSFALVTFLFSLWGFANDITNPMVAAFKNILLISNFQSSLVQFAFYGGYCVMAIPAALFIKRFSYKAGILVGLALYATGCLLFIPSGWMMAFWAFLISYFIMTCGLSFLETSSNPYILAMGPEETSTQRLNFAQSFNPMGSICGMLIASQVILINLNTTSETGRRYLEKVADGQLLHVLLHDESLASVKKAQLLVNEDNEVAFNTDQVKEVASSLDTARKALSCMAAPGIEKASEFKTELDTARKQAPGILTLALMKFTSNPEAEALQQAFQNQMNHLKDQFEGDRTLLDLTVQAVNEQKELLNIKPDLANQAMELSKTALVTVQQAQDKVKAAIKDQEKSSDVISASAFKESIKGELEACTASVEAAASMYHTINEGVMDPWFSASADRLSAIRKADLDVIIGPYTILGIVVLACLIIFAIARLPRIKGEEDTALHLGSTLKRLVTNAKYIEGVVAQAFYVGAQIMCWTFIIQYAENELGMEKATAQNYNILAMAIFVSSRFICTALLKYFSPGGLLMTLAIGGFGLVLGVIFMQGMTGLYCLIGVSACMSLMFPTIYGIALKGLGDDAKLGAAGLIMAIGGGCLMPPMQGAIMDMSAFNLGFMTLSSSRASFVLPLICFVVIAIYGFRTSNVHGHKY